VLVYASDRDSPEKRRVAKKLLARVARERTGVISTQILQEYYVTATRKLGTKPLQAREIITSFRFFELVVVQLEDISRAIDGSILWQLPFWDALILAAAEKASCSVGYPENPNPRQRYERVEVVNPFS